MADKIRLLADEVIGKIAAGEVVERPAAAIKEMIENSLDAGATAVTVEIRDGGISYFRVTDNGCGIPQGEIRMAFERHATSKITTAQDLHAIQTLGFRGEALASIAAVAKVTCVTRTKSDSSGVKVVNQGGRIESIEETACPEGTSFVVRDLFFNTPVRLKFLKKPTTEAGYVSDLMMRMILSRPDVSFRYINQGKTLYHSAGDGKLSSAIYSIYGKEIRSMLKVQGHQAGIVLEGYVGMGESGRATRVHQSFFINGRYMKSGVLSSGLEAACKEGVAPGRYPSCVLHLTMPYDMVDVNVHPNKLECRFQSDVVVSEAVEAIVRDAMTQKTPLDQPQMLTISPAPVKNIAPVVVKKQEVISSVSVAPIPNAGTIRERKSASEIAADSKKTADARPSDNVVPLPEKKIPAPVPGMQHKPLQPMRQMLLVNQPRADVFQEPPTAVRAFMQSYQQPVPVLPKDEKKAAEGMGQVESFLPDLPKPLRMIGVAFHSYILAEYDDNLLIIDQQGVHERLLFDKMMRGLDTQACAQELLVPLIVPATRREQQLLETHAELLQAIGLTVEPFGENEVSIRSIPMILGQPQAGSLLREVLDQLEGERGVISLEKRRAGILALACKKAVRSGERLNEADIRELVVSMVEKHIIPTSPRGTPLIVALSHTDIDRRFRRPQ